MLILVCTISNCYFAGIFQGAKLHVEYHYYMLRLANLYTSWEVCTFYYHPLTEADSHIPRLVYCAVLAGFALKETVVYLAIC